MKKACWGLVLLIGTAPSNAGITPQPGEWQSTETGMEDGKPAKPEIEKSCLTAAEARDATNVVKKMKEQMQGSGSHCEKVNIQESGNAVIFVMKCGMGQQFSIDMSGTFTFVSPTRYTGAVKSSIKMGDTTATSDKKIDAVRIGDCKKH